jgi:hypothetical protein
MVKKVGKGKSSSGGGGFTLIAALCVRSLTQIGKVTEIGCGHHVVVVIGIFVFSNQPASIVDHMTSGT